MGITATSEAGEGDEVAPGGLVRAVVVREELVADIVPMARLLAVAVCVAT
jgi:hypothetical protein